MKADSRIAVKDYRRAKNGAPPDSFFHSAVLRPHYGSTPPSVPSPYLVGGELSETARRGQRLFEDPKVDCAQCHPAPLFTDQTSHAVGTANRTDRRGDRFDTPTLVECWRTGPYLHDGSAVTLEEVLTMKNPKDEHGHTSHLAPAQIQDLVDYVRSL